MRHFLKNLNLFIWIAPSPFAISVIQFYIISGKWHCSPLYVLRYITWKIIVKLMSIIHSVIIVLKWRIYGGFEPKWVNSNYIHLEWRTSIFPYKDLQRRVCISIWEFVNRWLIIRCTDWCVFHCTNTNGSSNFCF